MLATWLRARQTPGACARTPCVSSRGMPAGRGMKAHWRNKRAPTSLSPMVFTAALTSGTEGKIAAQKSWDRALEQLREAMRHQNGQEPSAIEAATGSAEDMMQSRIDWAAVQRLAAMELVDDQASYDNEVLMLNEPFGLNGVVVTPKHHDVLAKHTLETAPAGWVANTGPDLVSKNLPPQSLWALPTMREAAMRRRHTWKKLALQRLSAALMICTFLRHANLPRFAESHPERMAEVIPHLRNVAFMTEAQVQVLRTKLLRKMEMLHQMPVDSTDNAIHTAMQGLDQPEVPHYLHDADGEFHDIAQRLNESISKQILQGKRTDDDGVLAFALAKICHNLFVSTAPPNLATFNMLLSGFRTWERPHLVDQTIAALYAHKIRPNEVTCVEILTHYVLQSQPDEFSSFVAKMRGADDALMLANPDITINEASSGRLIRLDEQKVLQKVHPAPMVFGALLKGVLHFAGFDRALDVYYEMKADGWGLDIAGLVMLLRRCIPKADWEGGLYLWEEINSIKMRCSAVDMVPAYYHMLSLCSITGNTTAFNQILNEVARRGMDRKDIIDKATDLTRKARNSGPNLAPAFTADNVLIAVSNYLDDVQSDAKKSVDKGNGDMMSSALVYEDEQLDLEKHDPNDDETRSVTREEAWSSWIEHEVGERPKDPKL